LSLNDLILSRSRFLNSRNTSSCEITDLLRLLLTDEDDEFAAAVDAVDVEYIYLES
jgi:hypothetical protein